MHSPWLHYRHWLPILQLSEASAAVEKKIRLGEMFEGLAQKSTALEAVSRLLRAVSTLQHTLKSSRSTNYGDSESNWRINSV